MKYDGAHKTVVGNATMLNAQPYLLYYSALGNKNIPVVELTSSDTNSDSESDTETEPENDHENDRENDLHLKAEEAKAAEKDAEAEIQRAEEKAAEIQKAMEKAELAAAEQEAAIKKIVEDAAQKIIDENTTFKLPKGLSRKKFKHGSNAQAKR